MADPTSSGDVDGGMVGLGVDAAEMLGGEGGAEVDDTLGTARSEVLPHPAPNEIAATTASKTMPARRR